ncbi:hypothetical protein SAMN02745944_05981, partial [Clostridium magnum DSM 2767]
KLKIKYYNKCGGGIGRRFVQALSRSCFDVASCLTDRYGVTSPQNQAG